MDMARPARIAVHFRKDQTGQDTESEILLRCAAPPANHSILPTTSRRVGWR